MFFVAAFSAFIFDVGAPVQELYQTEQRIVANWEAGFLADWQTPRGGEYVLPERVRVILRFLRSADAVEFRFSQAIRDDVEAQQRLVEGAYPSRVVDQARCFFSEAG